MSKTKQAKRKLISTNTNFEAKLGYSRAVVQGDWCFVSGTTGYNYAKGEMPESVSQQAANALFNIKAALENGGFEMGHVVRVRYYLKDVKDVAKIEKVLHDFFGNIRPAATMVVCDMIEEAMKIEIEVTAFKG